MIGRGGMGIVFEAEQVSLKRRVALKVLPFAAALDPQQLRRFQIEAQAAAQLHHTNIVPIFSVGCERGVHYYAMQFIEGQTLAAIIRDLRSMAGLTSSPPTDPPPESLARGERDVLHALCLSQEPAGGPDVSTTSDSERTRTRGTGMKKQQFEQLTASIRQAGAIRRGEMKPSRVTEFAPENVKAIRRSLGQSQTEFALMIGVSVSTLQNWEQGRRMPEGPARALLRVAAKNPVAVAEALGRPSARAAAKH